MHGVVLFFYVPMQVIVPMPALVLMHSIVMMIVSVFDTCSGYGSCSCLMHVIVYDACSYDDAYLLL